MAYQVVTPSHMMGLKHREPVFKTPMTFSPRLVGEQARPSPSRVDVWREQLGLDDDPYGCNGQPDMPSSDEEEVEQYQPQGEQVHSAIWGWFYWKSKGPSEDPGINQRGLMELFRETADRALEWQYDITVSIMEIYNEMIRDLLSSDPSYKMEVKMSPEGGLYVPGLTTIRVQSVEDINETFALGHRNRATACTNMNEHSSLLPLACSALCERDWEEQNYWSQDCGNTCGMLGKSRAVTL